MDDAIKNVLNYDENTGIFTWKISKGKARIGSVAGTDNNGYLRIVFQGKRYYAHRLAWYFMTGEIPEEIDHIDRDKFNNKFLNLRSVSRSENGLNKDKQKNNTTGYLGVQVHKRKSGSICYRSFFRRKHLGLFSTAEEAHLAYLRAKEGFINDNQYFSN